MTVDSVSISIRGINWQQYCVCMYFCTLLLVLVYIVIYYYILVC